MSEPLNWEATYAIAMALRRQFPNVQLEDVSLKQIYLWTIALPDFSDDPKITNEGILEEIFQIWFEETLNDDK
jgi:FeS assembly protein IscX